MTSLLQILTISMGIVFFLLILISLLINFTRNFFTRSRYIRVITYNDDKTINVKHFKKSTFNEDKGYLINPNHIFLLKGYITVTFTEHSKENINPLDFQSKYEAEMYETAIHTNLIEQTFNTLKSGKMDMLKIAVIVNMLTLALVAYLILKTTGVM